MTVALKMRLLVFPFGQHFDKPADKLERQIATLVLHNTETRQRLIDGIFAGESEHQPMHALNQAMILADEMESLEKKLRHAMKEGKLPALLGRELIDAGEEAGVLSKEEAKRMRDYDRKIIITHALSNLYLASMVLKHYEDQGSPLADLPWSSWPMNPCPWRSRWKVRIS